MRTLCDLQLAFGVSEGGEEVQFDSGLCTQAVLQVLSLILHGRQRGHQHLGVLLVLFIFMQLLKEDRASRLALHIEVCMLFMVRDHSLGIYVSLKGNTHLDFKLKLADQVFFDFNVQCEFFTLRLQLRYPPSQRLCALTSEERTKNKETD